MFFLLISINKHSNSPKGITNKEIQPSSKGFPNAKKIKLSGTKIRSAKSIKGKKTLKHAKNLDFIDIFLDDNILFFLKASIIPLAHLFLCLPNSLYFSGTTAYAMAFFAKLVS